MRAKLRDDLMYVATEDGVYLETGTTSTEISGGAAYGLIRRIAPHLDGSRTVAELTGSLPPHHQRLVTDLVTMLVHRGLARDLDREPPHRLQDWELSRYRQAIAFAEHAADAPLHRFESFRNGRVLLIGAGAGLVALVQTLFDLGLRTATLVDTAESPTDPAACQRILDRCRAGDPTVELSLRPDLAGALADDAALAALVGAYDAVLHCTDRLMAGRALSLNRVARAHGVPVLHALATAGSAWVGPTGAGAAGGCWECAVWSVHGTSRSGDAPLEKDQPDLVPEYLTPPVAALVGTALGFGYFRHAVGAETTATNRMTHIDLETAVTSEHLLGVHPRCRSCRRPVPADGLAERVAVMAARTPVDAETFATRVATLIDPRLGPVLDIGTGRQSQMSVSCIEATVADVAGTGTGPTTVTAIGSSRRQALSRAAVAAVEALAAQAATVTGTAAAAATVTDAAAAAATDLPHWWDPATGDIVTAEPTAPLVAAGFTWAEALGRALLRLRRAAATAPDPGHLPAAPADPAVPDGSVLDPAHWPEPVRTMAADMDVLGHELVAWRDAASTPTVFVGTASGWLSHTTAPDADTALEQAMQAAVAGLTGRSPAGADIGPDPGAGDWDACLTPLLKEVTDGGQRLLLRPVDDLPGTRDVLPFLVQAMLTPNTGSIG
ncbi:TOMM precursor leader peptide-binding protein [Micromonospora fluostatini]|uniref:TOMM leader peptide-binding protein n=1 Tax=Micromonospora fluostatini TaxID=1629071 RepID=A0ABY2DJ20_9ACTN|nr:TOMM precursor leader peptide-binding protein [Micromonospora fluostatini]